MPDFVGFPKIARLSREVIVTEKIDGTNAQVYIEEDGATIHAGSKGRWLTLENDNFGFARWVEEHREELLRLGPGRHFGEWWGSGIQRNYGLKGKVFSLFNVTRWTDDALRPACCRVVPIIHRGFFATDAIEGCLTGLRLLGSLAAPGFMRPEGIVVFHTAANVGFKKTLEKDEQPKGAEG